MKYNVYIFQHTLRNNKDLLKRMKTKILSDPTAKLVGKKPYKNGVYVFTNEVILI